MNFVFIFVKLIETVRVRPREIRILFYFLIVFNGISSHVVKQQGTAVVIRARAC